ncbi:MAG TPA: TAXI family TRAP transporter solute-binding subunit [Hyphomicrobiaceae bacterium]|nr:TAXI family TRAP transporter solute-binding subunit [Hyphomicrobiaceae bacterium]
MHCLGLRLAALIGAVLLAATGAVAREPHWPATLSIGTASAGGTYFVYGEGAARILTRELKSTVWARPTEGPSENIKLLEGGEIDLAFVTLGVARQAWNGAGDWTEGKRWRQNARPRLARLTVVGERRAPSRRRNDSNGSRSPAVKLRARQTLALKATVP